MTDAFGLNERLTQYLRALCDRVETGNGRSTTAQRLAASEARPIAPGMDEYLATVRECAVAVTDEQVAGIRAAGYTEDEVFELTIAAALGAARKRFGAGLCALVKAYGGDEDTSR